MAHRTLAILFLLLASVATLAQNGIPPNTTMVPVPLGFVNPLTGHLHLEIPISSIPERNGDPLITKLVYDSTLYLQNGNGYFGSPGGGINTIFGTSKHGITQFDTTTSACTDSGYPIGSVATYSNFRFRDINNTDHAIVNQNIYTQSVSCYSTTGTRDPNVGFPSTASGGDVDGLGYSFNITNYTQIQVTDVDGTVLDAFGGTPKDTNGNLGGSAPDTLGRMPVTFAGNAYFCPPTNTNPGFIYVRASDGTTQTYKLNCATYNVAEPNYPPGTVNLLSSLVLPDGTQYIFNYDSGTTGNHYGALLSVTLPTGAQETFAYNQPGYPGLVSSVTFGGATWNFNYVITIAGLNSKTVSTVTGPARYDSVTKSYLNDKSVFTSVLGGQPFVQTAQFYSGSSTLLKTVGITYTGALTSFPGTITTTLNDTGQASKVQYQYALNIRTRPSQIQEWDFGSATPTRTKIISYGIYHKPTSISLYTGDGTTGSPLSNTTYTYDEYSANYCTVPMLTNVTGATGHDDTNYGVAYLSRGNLTTVSRLISGTARAISHKCYDTLGNVTQEVDPAGHRTTYDYSEKWADAACIAAGTVTRGYPTTITDALGHRLQTKYYTCTGLPQSTSDENDILAGRSGTSRVYDAMGRLIQTNYPDGGSTTSIYTDIPGGFNVEKKRAIDATRSTDEFVYLDDLGREARHSIANDETMPWDKVDTCYDAFGHRSFVSSPYQAAISNAPQVCSGAGDAFAYDALGRINSVTHADTTSTTMSYSGAATSILDEGNGTARTQRISQVDGLGRLRSVCEVSGATLIGITPAPSACGLNIAATGFLTTYQYDILDNLTQVTQGGLNLRTFAYDGLSRLTSATNPESGTTTYAYDADSNLTQRVRPAPNQTGTATVTTTYSYDALHRLTGVNYSDTTPSVTRAYDETLIFGVSPQNPIGRLTHHTSAVGFAATTFSYDSMGRIINEWQSTPQNAGTGSFPLTYTYDLVGDMTSSNSILGVTLSYSYNRRQRPTQLTSSLSDASHPATLFSSAHYNPFGMLTSATLGNGLGETRAAVATGNGSGRGWLQSISVGASGGTYNLSMTYSPNGDVLTANDKANGNWTYTYDDFNRLVTAGKATQALSYVYDRFGNRWQQNVTLGTGPNPIYTFDASNRITTSGITYDAAGNVMNDGTHSYTYDAENRITAVDGGVTAQYTYEADGHRIRKVTSTSTLDYIFDLEGRAVSEVNTSGTRTRGEIYLGGRHLASYAGGTTAFDHSDWLGTVRVRTGAAGSILNSFTSLPFGDALNTVGSSPIHFTGKERDSESGLDNFIKRYHASSMGRFMSPDPLMILKQKLVDPQQWNMYSYSRNNPLRFMDPTGMYATDCGSLGAKDCANRDKQIDAFQAKLAASKNAQDQAIAKTLGTSKDTKNGVTIGFVKEFKNAEGKTLADKTGNTSGLFAAGQSTPEGRPVADIRIDLKGSLSGNDLSATVEHEGSHATDRMDFVNSCSATGCSQSFNLTGRQSEQNAYGAEYRFWQSVGQGQQHPMISSPDQINQFLRQHPDVYPPATLDNLLFPPDL